jgi:hypothetical protein
MGSAGARTGYEWRPLFPEENPDDSAVLVKQFLSVEAIYRRGLRKTEVFGAVRVEGA